VNTGGARQLRIEAGHTLRDVGDSLDVDPACVSRWERGERVPRGRNVVAYDRYLQRLAKTVAAERAA
jgi:transcriptional regulator with XRE-family HTH domain